VLATYRKVPPVWVEPKQPQNHKYMYQNHTQHQHQSVSLVLISVFCVAVLIYTCGLVALTGIFQLKIEASENLTV
jgi:hypothetical protein